jgi:hypothetical protein
MVNMAYTISFSALHSYGTLEPDITVPVELIVGEQRVTVPHVKLDTGASFCIFQQDYGELLGLDVETGLRERIKTPTGSFLAHGHEVLLSALGYEINLVVYFASLPGFTRNVLGRTGWLQQFRIGIIDYDGKLYVSKYDEPV